MLFFKEKVFIQDQFMVNLCILFLVVNSCSSFVSNILGVLEIFLFSSFIFFFNNIQEEVQLFGVFDLSFMLMFFVFNLEFVLLILVLFRLVVVDNQDINNLF